MDSLYRSHQAGLLIQDTFVFLEETMGISHLGMGKLVSAHVEGITTHRQASK